MSLVNAPPVPPPLIERPPSSKASKRRRKLIRRVLVSCIVLTAVAGLAYWSFHVYRALKASAGEQVPVATVDRSDLTFSVVARGELRGGNPETLTAPMTGGGDLHITFLKKTGSEVKPGDVVVQFDTSEQEFKLKEAQADLAEADQKITQAKAQRDAQKEEDQYALLKAQDDV